MLHNGYIDVKIRKVHDQWETIVVLELSET